MYRLYWWGAPLYTKCLFFWQHMNAAQDETGGLCRDAASWRRASDEISWGNNNRKKGGGSDEENLSCTLCLDFNPSSVRLRSRQRYVRSAAARRHLWRTARRRTEEAASSEREREDVTGHRGPVPFVTLWQNYGTTATTCLRSSARLRPVWVTGWSTGRVACGSIPEPSEGRDPSCSTTGSHASNAILVVHKAIHTPPVKSFTSHQLFSIHMTVT